ncbi:hypothetical protein LTR65_009005 [Meristemomyces frigidus]
MSTTNTNFDRFLAAQSDQHGNLHRTAGTAELEQGADVVVTEKLQQMEAKKSGATAIIERLKEEGAALDSREEALVTREVQVKKGQDELTAKEPKIEGGLVVTNIGASMSDAQDIGLMKANGHHVAAITGLQGKTDRLQADKQRIEAETAAKSEEVSCALHKIGKLEEGIEKVTETGAAFRDQFHSLPQKRAAHATGTSTTNDTVTQMPDSVADTISAANVTPTANTDLVANTKSNGKGSGDAQTGRGGRTRGGRSRAQKAGQRDGSLVEHAPDYGSFRGSGRGGRGGYRGRGGRGNGRGYHV